MATNLASLSDPTARRDVFAERILESVLGCFDVFTIFLGDRLGLYETLAKDGPLPSRDLAIRTRTHERYAREWLEQQAMSGILEIDDETRPAADRRYSLPAGHDEVLVDRDSLSYLSPLAHLLAGVARPLPRLLEAFRTGEGIPFSDYGEEACLGQAAMNRPSCSFWGRSRSSRFRTCTGASRPPPPPGSPMWVAARDGRASAWPGATPRSRWTASIWTTGRSGTRV